MINQFVQSLLNVVFSILRFFSSFTLTPIYNGISTLFPDLNNYLTSVNSFINEYIIKGISFIREVFFNLTYFPRDLMGVLVLLLTSGVALALSFTTIIFVVNIFKLYRNGDS